MAGGRFELAMEPMAIGLDSLNSNSEMHMTAICDLWEARLIYGRGGFHRYLYNMLCSFKFGWLRIYLSNSCDARLMYARMMDLTEFYMRWAFKPLE